jgi:hypothetical protein
MIDAKPSTLMRARIPVRKTTTSTSRRVKPAEFLISNEGFRRMSEQLKECEE